MTPSRSAHGQMSSSVDPEQVHRRLRDQRAGQQLRGPAGRDARAASARCGGGHPGQPAATCGAGVAAPGSAARTGPRPSGAAPAIRASDRNVLEVPTDPVGRAGPDDTRRATRAILGPDLLAQRLDVRRVGRVAGQHLPGEPAGAQRQAETAASGSSSRPAASSSEPPPMSSTSSRPLDQPNQRRTARKVSRASSSPSSTWSVDPGLVAHPRQDRLAVGRLADRAGGEGEEVLHALVLGDRQALLGELRPARRRRPGRCCRPAVEVLGQPQLDLVRRRRQRVAADVGVDDQQVHGVGSHVEDPESHGSNVATGAPRPPRQGRPLPRTDETVAALRLGPCPRLPWTSAARGSSSPTPPMPSSASAVT